MSPSARPKESARLGGHRRVLTAKRSTIKLRSRQAVARCATIQQVQCIGGFSPDELKSIGEVSPALNVVDTGLYLRRKSRHRYEVFGKARTEQPV